MKLSRYHVVSPALLDERTGESVVVIYSTRTGESRVLGEAAWRLLEAGEVHQLARAVLLELVELELLVPDDEDELAVVLARNNAAALDDDNLYLVVQSTAWCQLGCGYCGQSHTKKLLSTEDQAGVVERARAKLAARRYRTFELNWFGGEPLTGLTVMRTLTPPLRELADKAGVEFSAKVVTNGLALTDSVATELVRELGVTSIEVTLDGTAAYHDARRHTKKGLPTFNAIYSNVLRLARRTDLDVQITVRCNVDQRNFEGVSPLLHMFAEAGVHTRIAFYVAPIHSWGNDAHEGSLPKEVFADWEIRWFVEMAELGFGLALLPKRRPIVCFAVLPTAELVDANGELFNCTEVSYVPKYGRPNEYAIGTVAGGEQPGRRQRLALFNERVGRGEYDCSECRMLPVCGGCCPKLWEEGITPCPTPKFNIETRLLLRYAMARVEASAAAPEPVVPDAR